MRHPTAITASLAAVAAGAALVGCGGGDDSTTAASSGTTSSSTASSSDALEIGMGDNFFDPKDVTADAGSVTISAHNDGVSVHELVLAKTNADPADLPTTSDGAADEAKLESEGAGAGEIADVEPGASKEGTLKLSPGRYVMYCNVPGHYADGMYGSLTVK